MENKKESLLDMIDPLIAWYRDNRKHMPWRESSTPYRVWISEIMLQQTRMAAVIPYYERFMRAFPDVKSLADASEDQLMKLWEGLGYYSRARNLGRAAKMIVDEYGGELPQTAEELLKLPGVGNYTAGAIASISFGRPEPAVDGNVLRVIMRYLGRRDDIALPATKQLVTKLLRDVYPKGEKAGALTQAIMELGETLCIPNGEARCSTCPLLSLCVAGKNGISSELPYKSPKKERKKEDRTILLLSCRGRYAICRRKEGGLLAGLWEFPNLEGHLCEEEVASFLHVHGTNAVSVIPCGNAKHIFTHVEWHMIGYCVECVDATDAFLWRSAAEIRERYALPTALRAFSSQMED